MTKYLGVSMIVLGTIILLVSYLSQSCDAIAGMFPISWVDINGVQIIAFFNLVFGGILAHVLAGKLEGAGQADGETKSTSNTAMVGCGLAALGFIASAAAMGMGFAGQESFLSIGAVSYAVTVVWLIALACCMLGLAGNGKKVAAIGLGILFVTLIISFYNNVTIYALA